MPPLDVVVCPVSASWVDLYLSPRHVARNWDKLAASCSSSSLSWAGSCGIIIIAHNNYQDNGAHHTTPPTTNLTPHSSHHIQHTTYNNIILQSPTLILPPASVWNVAKIKHLGQQLLAVYFTVLHLSIVPILGPWLEPGACLVWLGMSLFILTLNFG